MVIDGTNCPARDRIVSRAMVGGGACSRFKGGVSAPENHEMGKARHVVPSNFMLPMVLRRTSVEN
jgi:hypothetical protein